jgi:hypothetical protein
MIKELRSIRSDPIMLGLVAYTFTIAVYAAARRDEPVSWSR